MGTIGETWERVMMKLNVRAMALTLGLLWALAVFGATWWMIACDGATGEPTILGRIYRGYSISPMGSLIGLLWALPDGLIGGVVLAWVYNALAVRGTGEG